MKANCLRPLGVITIWIELIYCNYNDIQCIRTFNAYFPLSQKINEFFRLLAL